MAHPPAALTTRCSSSISLRAQHRLHRGAHEESATSSFMARSILRIAGLVHLRESGAQEVIGMAASALYAS
jgi:hypothetical protein